MGLPAKLTSNQLSDLVNGATDVGVANNAVTYDAVGRLTALRMPAGGSPSARSGQALVVQFLKRIALVAPPPTRPTVPEFTLSVPKGPQAHRQRWDHHLWHQHQLYQVSTNQKRDCAVLTQSRSSLYPAR